MKRFLALLLVLALTLTTASAAFVAEGEATGAPTPLTEEDYVTADLMWEAVNAKEAAMLSKKAPISQTVEALIATVTASEYYAKDSLIRNGEHFFWETTDGIPCGYSPRLSDLARKAEPTEDAALAAETVLTASYSSRSGYPGTKDVFLIQPYYGIDSSFTTQYVTEANNIAKELGGKATTYRTTKATVDAIAKAMELGAVVIFDSHGDTDYAAGDDYTTYANTSYICLQSNSGLTAEDYKKAEGPFGNYYHAYYAGSYNSMKYYCVDGTAIANHMEKDAQNSMLWMALCLGMATDGLHKPLRSRGVEVAYGYSQSVTFDYDYAWEEVFWEQMLLGKTVAQGIASMKEKIGLWDWCHAYGYDTIDDAREMYCAFPIVVSSEDPYPGHGKVDDLQTVHSGWILAPCSHEDVVFVPGKPATCTEAGSVAYYQCSKCALFFADEALTIRITKEEIPLPATGHKYDGSETMTPPTCIAEGYTTYTCSLCGHSYTTDPIQATGHSYTSQITEPTCTAEGFTTYLCSLCSYSYITDSIAAIGHSFTDGVCTLCGEADPDTLPQNPFEDVKEEHYFYDPVLWAVKNGITNGTSATTFDPENSCTRGQVVTFLWRACGSPEVEETDNPFTDVEVDAYYYKAVLWAVEQGITIGINPTTFGPDVTCTRGQVATFLWRAQEEPTATDSSNPFTDVVHGEYYYEAVLWAVENSITQGTGNGTFSPHNSCTRGQIVTFLYRALSV